MIRTLHDWRWPFAAARASMWLLLAVPFALDTGVHSPHVNAADAPHAPRYVTRGDDVVLTVTADGAAFVGSNWAHDPGELLQWTRSHNPASRAVLRADHRAKFGNVRRLVAAARDAGYRRLTIDAGGELQPRLRHRFDAGWTVHFDTSHVVEEDGGGWHMSSDVWY